VGAEASAAWPAPGRGYDPAVSAEQAQQEVDVSLRDGSTVHVGPLRPSDRERLAGFFGGLSDESRAFRFFSGGVDLRRAAAASVEGVGSNGRYGLIATRGESDEVVGHAWCGAVGDSRAEIAFAIADKLQGQGLGTVLLAHLAELAHDAGIESFEAEVMSSNAKMLEVFRESGFPVEMSSKAGVVRVVLPTSFSPEAVERFSERERFAAAAAIRTMFAPRGIAMVGASRERGTVGGELFHNLISSGFPGPIYPVNRSSDVVQSVQAYRGLDQVPGPVDGGGSAAPAEHGIETARDCARAGVKCLVVVSAGFAETDEEGKERQRELVDVCRKAGVRLVGPNCLGILDTSRETPLNATFAPAMPPRGRVGFLSQSGALGLALIDLASESGLGVSSFASIGNRADISSNDLLEYWADDDATDVALLYLESFGNARKFSRIARRFGLRKPIVAVKSGRSRAGARATSSHTGAMIEASDVTVDALFRQAGVVRTDSLSELLDVATLLANQPLPAGRRVGIVTNVGGPGIMCADACEARGLEVPALSDTLRAELGGFLPKAASLGNPVDMLATATPEHFRETIRTLGTSSEVDALIAIYIPPLLAKAGDVLAALREALDGLPETMPAQVVLMSERQRDQFTGGRIPTHLFPEDAARALSRAVSYREWCERPRGELPDPRDVLVEEAAATIADALAQGPGWLDSSEVAAVLGAYGIPMAEWREAGDPAAAGQAAEELGGPVALKAVGDEIVHKSDLGAVRLELEGATQVAGAAREIDAALKEAGRSREGFVVQRMVAGGTEMLIGVVGDPLFGPVVACGAGGVQTELLKDVSVRLNPLTDRDASEMLRSLATFPVLTGYRGSEPADLDAIEQVLLRVSLLAENHKEIAELDLNPVVAGPSGAVVVDARIRVESAAPERPWPSV
jgi:acyl-CoA synthetase (NDP forming)/GNAT superfamily N-acetyltransferase